MPLKLLQNNDRVAEVQFVCDLCGKLIRTSFVPKNELDAQKNKAVMCCQCKQTCQTKKRKT